MINFCIPLHENTFVKGMQSLHMCSLNSATPVMEVTIMVSNENFKLDITFSLKEWGNCKPTFDKAMQHCHERATELRAAAKVDPIFKTTPHVPDADMYELCATMLLLAKGNHAQISSIVCNSKKEVSFAFVFSRENHASLFYENLVAWLKANHYIATRSEVYLRTAAV